jgi:hypothetical protein
MWESIKKFFGFGEKGNAVEVTIEAKVTSSAKVETPKVEAKVETPKVEAKVETPKVEAKVETPKVEVVKRPKTRKKVKSVDKSEAKVTAKDIKSIVTKEEPKVNTKSSKSRKPKSKVN